MNTLEILKAARELISDPKHHTKKMFARNAAGYEVTCGDPSAVCWCSVGAVNHAAIRQLDFGGLLYDGDAIQAAIARLSAAIGHQSVVDYNDHTTHAYVLEMFDKAIASLEGAQS